MMPLALILSALGLAQNESDNWRTLHPEWIWCDDFEQDVLGSYFGYDSAGGDFVRVAGAGIGGSTAMRGHFHAGQVSAGSLHLAFGRTPSATFRPVDAGTKDYREIYWRVYVRNQPGWTGGGGNKFSRAIVFATSNWAEAAIGHVWSGGPAPGNYLGLDPASGTDTAGNLRTTMYNDFANLRWLGWVQGQTPLFDSAHVGQWHRVEAHMKLNTPGQSDGVFEFWIDGQLDAQHTGLDWCGSYTSFGINAVFLENYWNAGSTVDQERYFDNFVVSTRPIGPIGATGTPAGPTITQEPQSQSVAVGQKATFSVGATGTGPLSYQWQKEDPGAGAFSNLAGETAISYTTPAATVAMSGTKYRVLVSNSAGSVTSTAAVLTVGGGSPGGGTPPGSTPPGTSPPGSTPPAAAPTAGSSSGSGDQKTCGVGAVGAQSPSLSVLLLAAISLALSQVRRR